MKEVFKREGVTHWCQMLLRNGAGWDLWELAVWRLMVLLLYAFMRVIEEEQNWAIATL